MKRAPSLGCLLLSLVSLLSLAACALPGANEVAGQPVNACGGDSDCGANAACEAGRCVSTSYDLGGLLLEVQIDPSWSFAPGSAFVVDPSEDGLQLVSTSAHDTPFGTRLDVGLPAPISIQGAQVVLDTPPGPCGAPDGSVPANVTFYRVPKFAGLPTDVVPATTNVTGGTFGFDVDLVSGPDDRYDVYIEPIQLSAGCDLAPTLITNQLIDESKTVWQLPAPSVLGGTIAVTPSTDMWLLDVVEPTRGLRISSPSASLKGSAAFARFTPPLDPTSSPVLRLSSAGSTPEASFSLLWSLTGTATGGTKTAPTVSLTADVSQAPHVVAGKVTSTSGAPVESQILVQSAQITSMDVAFNASVAFNIATDATGSFSLTLPPGEYTVRAIPAGVGDFAIQDTPLSVPLCAICTSFSITLLPKATLSAKVITPTGATLTATPVEAVSSIAVAGSYLAKTHLLSALPSRSALTSTDGSGSFALRLDSGASDLLVEPDPATNYPWLVVPGLTPGAALPTLTLTTPAFLDGTLTDPTGAPIANAEVDAWFPLRDSSSPTGLSGTVVRIATTTTDANGIYTLVLPSSL